jgi:hypothetical protein
VRLFFALPLLLAACAAAAAPEAAAPVLSSIAMDRNSWGRPAARWSIDASGKGSYTLPEPDVFNAERLVTRGFTAGSEGFAEIRKLLATGEAHAGRELVCGERITDQYYGTVHWDGASLTYDMGCQDKATEVVLKGITAAERKIAAWAANQPILETRKVERQ